MNNEYIKAYPLAWPGGWPRTPGAKRIAGKFNKKSTKYGEHGGSWQQTYDITISDAVDRVLHQLDVMGLHRDDIIISTNLETRMDGLPRSKQRKPGDPGAAVYWEASDGGRKTIAVDRYHNVEHNIAAIGATLEALRGIARWGGAQILERAFTGFVALESPIASAGRVLNWWETLEVSRDAPEHEIEKAYRVKRKHAHSDHGGSDAEFMIVQAAYKVAQRERGFV